VKYLFIARQFTQFRNYDSVLTALARRGHRVHLADEKADGFGGEAAVRALAAEHPGITCGWLPERRADGPTDLVRRVRLALDYLRYLDPLYDAAPLRRERGRLRAPRALAALATPPLVGGPRWRALYGRFLHRLDQAMDPPSAIVAYVRAQAPDALLVTPLVELGSQQIDYVRAARRLAVPCGLAVWSWDHLTSKALLREHPERVYVWNDTQRREAVEAHGVPADRIAVTGAQCFDHWFERRPSRSREALCAELGLDPTRPILLYVCSGLIQGSPPEIDFAREWLGWVRASADGAVATANVLIRPHPQQAAGWREADWSAWGPVAVWGANPIDEPTRTDYFDSLWHSAAVVGLNTSAFLEAAIAGRAVLAVLVPRFHDNQDGTAHFRYLRQIGGGVLRVAADADAHRAQLSAALARPAGGDHPHRAFLEAFVRPRGLDVPATPVLVEAIEALPAVAPLGDADAPAAWARALRAGGLRLGAAIVGESLMASPREREAARWHTVQARRQGLRDKQRARARRERAQRWQRRRQAATRLGRQWVARVRRWA
jgi:hypothetical protein